jgi:hypothetical protein
MYSGIDLDGIGEMLLIGFVGEGSMISPEKNRT